MTSSLSLISSVQDQLHLYHLLVKGTDEQIGRELGALAKNTHRIDKSFSSDQGLLKDPYEYLKQWYPEHYARMSGFARAFGTGLEDGRYDFSFFGEVPEGTACSAVHYPPAVTRTGHGYISRNLDFSLPRELSLPGFPFKHTYVIELYPQSCYPSICLFCFEVFGLALEGINSQGLAVIHLADADTAMDHPDLATHRTRKGFNEFLPIQYLLDRCATAGEARQALKSLKHYHVAIPVHLLIADRLGDSFVFEYSPDGTQKVFVRGSGTTPLKITNFQLNRLSGRTEAKKMAARPDPNDPDPNDLGQNSYSFDQHGFDQQGFNRYRTLERTIDATHPPYTEQAIRQINAGVYVHAETETTRERTLFHSLYDTSACSVKICHMPTIPNPDLRHPAVRFHEFTFRYQGHNKPTQ